MERFKALNVENDESEDIDHTLTTEKLTNVNEAIMFFFLDFSYFE